MDPSQLCTVLVDQLCQVSCRNLRRRIGEGREVDQDHGRVLGPARGCLEKIRVNARLGGGLEPPLDLRRRAKARHEVGPAGLFGSRLEIPANVCPPAFAQATFLEVPAHLGAAHRGDLARDLLEQKRLHRRPPPLGFLLQKPHFDGPIELRLEQAMDILLVPVDLHGHRPLQLRAPDDLPVDPRHDRIVRPRLQEGRPCLSGILGTASCEDRSPDRQERKQTCMDRR